MRLPEVLFELAFVCLVAAVGLMLASVLATSPLGVFAPMAGIVDWEWAVVLARPTTSSRLNKDFIGEIRKRKTGRC